jgi:MYXO-CTERM domain-containing protein
MASRSLFASLLLPVLLAPALGRCGAPPEEGRRYATTSRLIINGTADTSQAHTAVVALTYGPGSGAFCSGTLIAPNVVLTAAHCLENVQQQWVQVFFGDDVSQTGSYRGVSDLLPHPTYGGGGAMQGDLGLIRLSSNAPATVTPIPALPASLGLTSADVGVSVDFSGFGVTELNTDGVKLHVQAPIGYVCNQASTCQGYIAPYGFEYSQGGGGPCSGDSGGPAFILRGGTEYVAGVTSYGDPNCTQYGVSTMVDPYISWINGYIGVASEDCGNGLDDDGDGLVDCADPDCATAPSCTAPPELCGNGVDDDGDGAIDCADPDCAGDPACLSAEQCANGVDDDGDGAIDCADPDCATDAYCLAGQELCVNGVDDDGDGAADCADPDCATAPNCQPEPPGLTRGGCNCRQSSPASSPLLPILALLLLGLTVRRRRR